MRLEVLELVEYEESVVADDIVREVDSSFWDALAIKVTRAPGEAHWRIRPDALAGIARIRQTRLDLTVHVRPKLEKADVAFLADHAYGQRVDALRRPQLDRVGVDSSYEEPIATLLLWYLEALSEFATRWLRRSYRSNRTTLKGHVRGRFLVTKYVSQNLATARNADVPCVITERTIDTPNNRVLKAGLRRVAKLAQDLPIAGARQRVRGAVNAVLPKFAEVTDVEVGPVELRATSVNGPQRHYAAILQTTMDLLDGRFLGHSLGSSQIQSFLWSMPNLFQEALRGIIHESAKFIIDGSRRPSAKYFDGHGVRLRSSRIDPDYVLTSGQGTLLLDAKYKDALGQARQNDNLLISSHGPSLSVSRSDIYQMVAYRQHPAWQDASIALAYPVVLGPDESLPAPYEVTGFGEPVKLVFVDVGPSARSNLTQFIKTLESV